MQLNGAQRDAVQHAAGPLLVFAGAGSGKTRVITYRVANLVGTHGVPPYRILAVTFTNKAAGEMKQRLVEIAGEDIGRDLWVGTFHSICCRLLRRYHDQVGLERGFVIYDDSDQKAMVTRIIRAMSLDERLFPPKLVLSRIHRQKQEGRLPSEVEPDTTFDETHVEVFDRYEKAMRAASAVDFDDLILHVMRLAEHKTNPAGRELRDRFDYLLVDEFQDTNSIQYRLVRALAARSRNLCVVGDDDQSIYSWRGADIRNIRGFRKDFPDATIVKLEQNYRSSGKIVAAAMGVIQAASGREPKHLFTEAEPGVNILLRTVRDEREEALRIVQSVREEVAHGASPEDIAVFYRVNAQSRVLEEAFRTERIPYQIIGGMRFFDRAEVKDILSYLRLIENPLSDADLLRVINTPTRGIGNKTIDTLLALASRHSVSGYSAIEIALENKELGASAKKKLLAFRDLMEALRGLSKTHSPQELASAILEKTGYRQGLRDADTAEADARLENLEEFLGSLTEYENEAAASGQPPDLAGYLERVSLVADIDSTSPGPMVLLMTVHASKGLEFDSVYLTGMEEEMFPYRGLDADSIDELEEERRLAYVAITRARKRLTISHATSRMIFGQTRYQAPSRFLANLPSQIVTREGQGLAAAAHARAGEGRSYGGGSYGGGSYGGYRARKTYDEFDQRDEWVPSAEPASPKASPVDATDATPAGAVQVDYEAFDDYSSIADRIRRGTRVVHKRFGRGLVERVEPGDIPQVVARFPGFGSRKVLATYLRFE
ncbi:MAG: ATP-dependent helicase PcrA [Pseudomonadota bacterium]|jgi:DNA helicase-2/ATP-dependent DNA helicase PcrA